MNASQAPSPLWNPYAGGVALGIVLFLSYFLTGAGLGGSGGIARLVTGVADQVAPTVVNRNPYFSRMGGGAANPLDDRMIWMMLGLVAGGCASGLAAGRWKIETFRGPAVSVKTRWLLAVAGGLLMGVGAGIARGCTSGQALSGGAVLAVGSWAFMMMVFAGGYALAWPLRRLWN